MKKPWTAKDEAHFKRLSKCRDQAFGMTVEEATIDLLREAIKSISLGRCTDMEIQVRPIWSRDDRPGDTLAAQHMTISFTRPL